MQLISFTIKSSEISQSALFVC